MATQNYLIEISQGRNPRKPLRVKMVGGEGFEPSKSKTADLQSAPFGHSGIHPFTVTAPEERVVIRDTGRVPPLQAGICPRFPRLRVRVLCGMPGSL